MFHRTIVVCLVGLFLVKLVKMDPSVTFNIKVYSKTLQSKSHVFLTCDHTKEQIEQSKETFQYTVYEGGNFTIVTKYNKPINHIICHTISDNNPFTPVNRNVTKSETTFTGAKIMGTIWKCEILAHRDNGVIGTVVDHKDRDGRNRKYSAVSCYMRLHVRQKAAPQTILVNNMELPAVRTNLSQKDVDFIAEYQYVDGDAVNVICMKKCDTCHNMLSMEYNMAGTMSDKSTMDDLRSSKMIGFSTKLHSGHNNSYMICTHIEDDDYTKVMVKFVMRTNFNNIVSVKINGMFVRPHQLYNPFYKRYRLDYKNVVSKTINITFEVERTDVKLHVFDEDFVRLNSYKKTELITNKKVKTSFYLSHAVTNNQLECCTEYLNGTTAELVAIYFTAGIFPTDFYPLHMELPPNGRAMELYNDYKLNVIFYEFQDGETLRLSCGKISLLPPPAPVLYLELDSATCQKNGCSVYKMLSVTRENENTPISCYLKEQRNPSDSGVISFVQREIRVILREKVLTTTTATTTTAFTTNQTAGNPVPKILTDVLLLGSSIGAVLGLLAVAVAVFCFIRNRTKHIEIPNGDLSNKSDIPTSQQTKENENQYDLCHYSDHLSYRDKTYNIPEGEEDIDPKYHQYTEIDYLSCKPKICETQIRNSRVYDEPYVHINNHD